MKLNFIFTIILLIQATRSNLFAQQPVRLEEAIQIALNNNGKLKAESKTLDYRKALVNTAYTLSPLQITGEFGQFNSAYFDTGFGISQNFALPGVYKKRARAYVQSAKSAEAGIKLAEAELKQQLHTWFAEYNYLQALEKLMVYQDSLYDRFLEKARLRWQQGETDQLEITTAEQQKINIAGELASIASMKDVVLKEIDMLLNDGRQFVPVTGSFDIVPLLFTDKTVARSAHPALASAASEIEAAKAVTSSEKTVLQPQFNIGYRNIGIRGTGADDIVYDASDRFQSFQVGIGFPLFTKGYRASIQAARIQEEAKTIAYGNIQNDLNTQVQQQYILYRQAVNQIEQFKVKSLPNARLIRTVSEKKFAGGEINYLEFVVLTSQAVQIERDYLSLIRKANSHIINLHFLTQPE